MSSGTNPLNTDTNNLNTNNLNTSNLNTNTNNFNTNTSNLNANTSNLNTNNLNTSNLNINQQKNNISSQQQGSGMVSRFRSIAYSIFPFLDPGSKSNVIANCEKIEGDTTWVGRIYKYVFGLLRFPGTDGVFIRIATTNRICPPQLFDFIRLIPQYLFYFVNIIILLSITYPDFIYEGSRLQMIFSTGIGIILGGWVISFVIQSFQLQNPLISFPFNLLIYGFMIMFYTSLSITNKTWNDFFWKFFLIAIYSQIQWLSPLILLLLGPGVIPLIQQKSFIEFCL
jgi:hypothetical protein